MAGLGMAKGMGTRRLRADRAEGSTTRYTAHEKAGGSQSLQAGRAAKALRAGRHEQRNLQGAPPVLAAETAANQSGTNAPAHCTDACTLRFCSPGAPLLRPARCRHARVRQDGCASGMPLLQQCFAVGSPDLDRHRWHYRSSAQFCQPLASSCPATPPTACLSQPSARPAARHLRRTKMLTRPLIRFTAIQPCRGQA